MKNPFNSLLLTTFLLITCVARAQKCPTESSLVTFGGSNSYVTISACVGKKPSLGSQKVLWGVKNNTMDELEVRFTKVVYLVCGNAKKNEASVVIKPGAFMGGGVFFGDDITLDDQIWKEDCNRNDNRIQRVGYENLRVVNLSKKERDNEAKLKIQADLRREEELARKKEEEQEAAQKIADTERQKTQVEEEAKKKELARLQAEEYVREKARMEEEIRKENKRIQDSTDETWKERNERVAAHKQDQQEKAALTAGMAAGVAALMLADTDNSKIKGRKTYFKLAAFMGIKNIPVYENTSSSLNRALNYTSTSDHLPIFGEVELLAMLFKSEWFSFEISPDFQYGMTFFGGDNGSYMGYGGNSTITLGKKVKIYATAGYEARFGDNTYDHDAGAESIGIITNTKAIGLSSYDYSVISYGGGIYFDTNSSYAEGKEDKFFQLGAIVHQPSLTPTGSQSPNTPIKTIIGAQLKWVMGGGFAFSAEYLPNYAIAGTKTFQTFSTDKKAFWYGKIGKTFNLSKSR